MAGRSRLRDFEDVDKKFHNGDRKEEDGNKMDQVIDSDTDSGFHSRKDTVHKGHHDKVLKLNLSDLNTGE